MVTLLENSAPALRVEGLRKAYDDVVAVDGLNLQVETGECFGLLGPNGAGKTTTIEICEGLLAADSGSVEVLGRRWESDADDLRELLGIQLQDTQLSEKLTVDETLTLFQSFYRDARDVGEVVDQVTGEKRYPVSADCRVQSSVLAVMRPRWHQPFPRRADDRPDPCRGGSCGS
jgi:ABC-type multidrug transport system ATPase subunit